jgi:hypothetical protein
MTHDPRFKSINNGSTRVSMEMALKLSEDVVEEQQATTHRCEPPWPLSLTQCENSFEKRTKGPAFIEDFKSGLGFLNCCSFYIAQQETCMWQTNVAIGMDGVYGMQLSVLWTMQNQDVARSVAI